MDQSFNNTSVNVDTTGVVKMLLQVLIKPDNPIIKNYTQELTKATNGTINSSTHQLQNASQQLNNAQSKLDDVVDTINDTADGVKGFNDDTEKQLNTMLKLALGILAVGVVLSVLGLLNMIVCGIWKAPLLHMMLHSTWANVATCTGGGKVIAFIIAALVSLLLLGLPLVAPIGLLVIVYKYGDINNWW